MVHEDRPDDGRDPTRDRTGTEGKPDSGSLNTELLRIYLNDHLTAATTEAELARRIARTHPELRSLAGEIEEDRQHLLRYIREFDVAAQPHKAALGWAAEKIGRLKLNGSMLTRSPLSDAVELEGLKLAIEARRSMWQALRQVHVDPELYQLAERAAAQAALVEELRLSAFGNALRQPGGSGVDVDRTFTVASSPSDVVSYLRDFSRAEQWDPGTVSCSRMDDGPVQVGARWRNVSKFLGRRTELVYELTRDEPQRLRFVGRNKTATSTDDIVVAAGDAPGTTDIRYHAHVELHGLAALGSVVAKVALEKLGNETEKSLTRVLGRPAAGPMTGRAPVGQ